jgi:hypothetical protein
MAQLRALSAADVGELLDGEPAPGASVTLGRYFPEEPSCR